MFGPWSEISGGRDRDSEVSLEFFVDVLERGRDSDAILDGEAESVSLPCSMVRILSKDDYFHLIEVGGIEGIEDIFSFRENYFSFSFFFLEKCFDLLEIGFLEFISEDGFSRLLYLDGHKIVENQ